MSTDREKCGLSSLLPMSCRGRAEAFARRLHTRLSSLGNHHNNDDTAANETSWLGNHENPIAISQPRHTSDSSADIYFDFGETGSPNSPEEELVHPELEMLLNSDNLKVSHHQDECTIVTRDDKLKPLANGYKRNDSDTSEGGVFYDTTDDDLLLDVNGIEICDNGGQEDQFYSTTSSSTDNTVPAESSISEDISNLSLSCDNPSLESSEPSISNGGTTPHNNIINGSISSLIIVNGDEINDDTSTAGLINNDSSSESNGRLPETEDCNESDNNISSNITKELTVECPNQNNLKSDLLQTREELGEEDEEDPIPRVRRCSSLKTGKTPPGTPIRKKFVRFADVLGLDLADVRTFLDDIPKIPTSAYNDLKIVDFNDEPDAALTTLDPHLKFHGIKMDKVLVPLFQQPGGLPDFMDKVRDKCVCLENTVLEDPIAFCIKGTVRVRNLDFHKSVYIRYSLDQWKSFADVQAIYLDNSCDGFSDKFTFTIYAHTLGVGQRLEFACRFHCKGCQYWDNNNGINYVFQCLPSSQNPVTYTPITGVDESWGASFY